MNAGRELDALIVEKVYGWQTGVYRDVFGDTLYIVDQTATRAGEHSTIASLLGASWQRGYDAENNLVEFYGRICPAYSTDIAAAWQVVEWAAQRTEDDLTFDDLTFSWEGPIFKPSRRYLTAEGYPLDTTCWFVTLEAGGLRYVVCADTAPLAICLAALKAVEAAE